MSDAKERIDALVKANDVVLFMKGSALFPQCGFSSRAVAILPALADARVARIWGGLLDMTPDALPIIERSPEIDGLVIATGFSGHGFCLGPVTGRILPALGV